MNEPYLQHFTIRWDDLDVNRHVANTAYAHYMIQTRMAWFLERGFGHPDFERERIGPAILREEFHYLQEAPTEGTLRVSLLLSGLSADERFIRFNQSVYLPNGDMGVFARCTFCWMDLDKRRVREAPATLAEALRSIPRSADFVELRKADAFPVGLARQPIAPLTQTP